MESLLEVIYYNLKIIKIKGERLLRGLLKLNGLLEGEFGLNFLIVSLIFFL